ncbi:MAG: hypothetical protein PHT34_00340 [Oscillospiraceae bacterium]|nr:hypothetical protein [Oscillospiraceae bacterium]
MRRFLTCAPMILLILLLCACGKDSKAEERALSIRAQMAGTSAMTMQADVTADYGDRVYAYTLKLDWKKEGQSVLAVLKPDNIKGVTAVLEEGKTKLSFEGASLDTGELSPDGLSPLDALPALIQNSREGYISDTAFSKCGDVPAVAVTYGAPQEGEDQMVTCRIWYREDTGAPLQAEILNGGKAVIHCAFTSFSLGS